MGVYGFTKHLNSASQPHVEPTTTALSEGDVLLIDGSSWCFHLYKSFCEKTVVDSSNVKRAYWGGAYPDFDTLITSYVTQLQVKFGLKIFVYTDGDRNGTIKDATAAGSAAATPGGMPFKKVLDMMRFETWLRRQHGRAREWSMLEQWCRDGTDAADEAFSLDDETRYSFPLPELTMSQFYATMARLNVPIFTCPDEADMVLARACAANDAYIITNDTDLMFYQGTKVILCKDLDDCALELHAVLPLVAKTWISDNLCSAMLTPSVLMSSSTSPAVVANIKRDHGRWADVALMMGNDFSHPVELHELLDAVGYPKNHSAAAAGDLPPRPTTRKASAVLAWAVKLPVGWTMAHALMMHSAMHPVLADSRIAFVRELILFSTSIYLGRPYMPLQQAALNEHLAAMEVIVANINDDDKRRADVLRLHLDVELDAAMIPDSVWAVFGSTNSIGEAAIRACRMIFPMVVQVDHMNALQRMLSALETLQGKAQALEAIRKAEQVPVTSDAAVAGGADDNNNMRHQPHWDDLLVGVLYQRMIKRLQRLALEANEDNFVVMPSVEFEGRIFHYFLKQERLTSGLKQKKKNESVATATSAQAIAPPSTPIRALNNVGAAGTPNGATAAGAASATKSKKKLQRERRTARKKEKKAQAIAADPHQNSNDASAFSSASVHQHQQQQLQVNINTTATSNGVNSATPSKSQRKKENKRLAKKAQQKLDRRSSNGACSPHQQQQQQQQQQQPQTPAAIAAATETTTSANNYNQYLPIDDHELEIVDMIGGSQVSIVQGETGSGKSSRVPIMLLRNSLRSDNNLPVARIIISQPRRIACKGLFNRLSQDPQYGHLMGMRIGHGERDGAYNLNSGTGPGKGGLRGMVCCVTPGYLTRLLANHPKSLQNVTHIIIDEVHERSIDTDLLCYLARDLLLRQSNTRLVLMSATVNTSIYQRYFENERNSLPEPAFVGVRKFPVAEFYADSDLSQFGVSDKCKALAQKLKFACASGRSVEAPDKNMTPIQHELVVELAIATGRPGSAVLVFVAGMGDIETLSDLFGEATSPQGFEFQVIGIHSQLPFESQMAAFEDSAPNIVKIVVATNAAESSVTIPDADTVICMGTCKEIVYNPATNRTVLAPRWVSQSAAVQRAGRTGRVRPGRVIRLYTKTMFKSMDKNPRAEIHQQPLDAVILMMRAIWDDAPVKGVLSSLIEPPKIAYMDRAYEQLHEANLVTDPDDEIAKTTSLGQFVSGLGIDPYLGRLIGLGIIFGVARESLVLASVLSMNKSPFLMTSRLFQEAEQLNSISRSVVVAYWRWDQGVLLSEPLTVMRIYLAYEQVLKTQERHKSNMFLKANALNQGRMNQLMSTVKSLRTRVASMLVQIEKSSEAPTTRYARNYNQRDSVFESLLHFQTNEDPTCPLDPKNVCILRWLLVWVGVDQVFKLQGQIKPPRFTELSPQSMMSSPLSVMSRDTGAGANGATSSMPNNNSMSTPVRGANSNSASSSNALPPVTPNAKMSKNQKKKSQKKEKKKQTMHMMATPNNSKNNGGAARGESAPRRLAMRVQVIDPAHSGKNQVTDADLELLFSSKTTLSSLAAPSVPFTTPRKPSKAQLQNAATARAATEAATAYASIMSTTTVAPFLFDPNDQLFELVNTSKSKLAASLVNAAGGVAINNAPVVENMCRDWCGNKNVQVAAFAYTMRVDEVDAKKQKKNKKNKNNNRDGGMHYDEDDSDYFSSDDEVDDTYYSDDDYENALETRENMEDTISQMLANVSMQDSWAGEDGGGGGTRANDGEADFSLRRRLRVRLTREWCESNPDALGGLCNTLNGSLTFDLAMPEWADVTAEFTKGNKTSVKQFLKSFDRSVLVNFTNSVVDVVCTSVSLTAEDLQDVIGDNVRVSKQTLESKVDILFPVIADQSYFPPSHQSSTLRDAASGLHPTRLWIPPIGVQLLGVASGWGRNWGGKKAKLSANLAKAGLNKPINNSHSNNNTPKPKTPKGETPDDVLVVDLSINEGKWVRAFTAEDRETASSIIFVKLSNPLSLARLLTFHPVNAESGTIDGAQLHRGIDTSNGVEPARSNVSLYAVAGLMMDIENGPSRADWVTILPPTGRSGHDWILKAMLCCDVLEELEHVVDADSSIDEETEVLCQQVGRRLRYTQTIAYDEQLRNDVLSVFST